MERHFDQDLKLIRTRILEMGEFVEQAINLATKALLNKEPALFQKVYEIEKKINHSQVLIDEMCLRLLARQAPLATDLRFVLALIKINGDLERMGDQAVNISHNAEDYLKRDGVKELVDLPVMAEDVKTMVRDALRSFLERNVDLAQKVLNTDDKVDKLKNQIFYELKTFMSQHPDKVDGALDLILIARNLERLGDHATNIAEDAIFVVTGQDIRHGHFRRD